MSKNIKRAKRIFQFSGVYGIAVLLPQYFLETKTGIDFPPPITHPEFFYGFVGLGLVWQIAFFLIATDPVRYRPFMLCGILEKLSFGIAATVLFLLHRLSPLIAFSGFLDFLFAGAFLFAYLNTKE